MSVPEGKTFIRVPVNMINASGIGFDDKGRIVCVSPPYAIGGISRPGCRIYRRSF